MNAARSISFAGRLLTCLGAVALAMPSSHAAGTVSASTTAALLQALSGGGLVQITTADPIVLDLPLIISMDTVVEGAAPGARTVTLSGGGKHRIFQVLPGVRLEVRGITLREGVSTNGGAIYNEGMLRAENVIFTASKASGSEGVAGINGGSRFGFGENGTAGGGGGPAAGGAIFNVGEAFFTGCSFLVNEARGGDGGDGGDGGAGASRAGNGGNGGHGAPGRGGAFVNTGLVTVTNCLFNGNVARGGDGGAGGTGTGAGQGGAGAEAAGGAILNLNRLYLTASSFTTNLVIAGSSADAGSPGVVFGNAGFPGASGYGGAVATWSNAVVRNSTFYTNLVSGGTGGAGAKGSTVSGDGGHGGHALGGAIHVRGSLAMTNATLAWNAVGAGAGGAGGGSPGGSAGNAGTSGGAALAADSGADVGAINTIFATAAGLGVPNVHGPFEDLGHNLFNDAGPTTPGVGSLRNLDPKLSAFGIWAAGTPGFLPVAGSPAIDAADAAAAPSTDQRGNARPTGRGPEIGAMEVANSSSGFILSGRVLSGTNGIAGKGVTIGTNTVVTGTDGRYKFGPLPPGPYTVFLENGGMGFTPRVHQIQLGVDQLNVNFVVAPLILTLARPVEGGGLSLSAAGIPGRTYTLEFSPDLVTWEAVETRTADSQGRASFARPPGTTPEGYFRLRQD